MQGLAELLAVAIWGTVTLADIAEPLTMNIREGSVTLINFSNMNSV